MTASRVSIVIASHLRHVLALLWVCALSVWASAEPGARSPSDTSIADRPLSPLTVVCTDELYKPALLPDGRLIAVALPKIDGVQHAEAIYSKDNGHTWSEPTTIFSLPPDEGNFCFWNYLVDRTGEIHFFFLLDPSTGADWRRTHSETPIPFAELHISYVRSSDHATQWQAPRRIWEGRAGALLSVIQLRSGRLLLPICYRTNRNWTNRGDGIDDYTYRGQFDSSALYSDDGGTSWKQSPSALRVPTPDLETILGAVDPVLLQLKDGRVWMLIRTQVGRLYESFSNDEGQTWSAAVPTTLDSSDSPPGLVRLSDGRIVMILNSCLRFPYAYGGRHVLHAAVSDDDGRTWHGFRELVRDPLRGQPPPPSGDWGQAYPYPTVTKDDKVLFGLGVATGTSGGQPDKSPGLTQKRNLTLFDPLWLTETSQHTDFSDGLNDWSAFGVKGVEISQHPTRSDAQVLNIRKTVSTWPSAAVWNFPMGVRGRVRLSLLLKPGFGGAVIGLTDHYSVPFDGEDTIHNVYNFAIGADGQLTGGGKLDPDRWHQVDLNWDTVAGNAHVEVDGRQAAQLPAKRDAVGVSYLRLRSTVSDTDLAGFLVESVEATIQP